MPQTENGVRFSRPRLNEAELGLLVRVVDYALGGSLTVEAKELVLLKAIRERLSEVRPGGTHLRTIGEIAPNLEA